MKKIIIISFRRLENIDDLIYNNNWTQCIILRNRFNDETFKTSTQIIKDELNKIHKFIDIFDIFILWHYQVDTHKKSLCGMCFIFNWTHAAIYLSLLKVVSLKNIWGILKHVFYIFKTKAIIINKKQTYVLLKGKKIINYSIIVLLLPKLI